MSFLTCIRWCNLFCLLDFWFPFLQPHNYLSSSVYLFPSFTPCTVEALLSKCTDNSIYKHLWRCLFSLYLKTMWEQKKWPFMVKPRCYGKHEDYVSYRNIFSIQIFFSEHICFKWVGGISQFPQFFGIIPVNDWLYNILLYLNVITHLDVHPLHLHMLQ